MMVTDELENLARAIGMREWHTDHTIHVDFGSYFWVNRQRLLREAAVFQRTWAERNGDSKAG